MYLYLPQGTYIIPDSSVQHFDSSNNLFFNLHYSSDEYIYMITKDQVKCINCPLEENEYNDVSSDSTSTSVTINREGILIEEKNKEVKNKDFKGLEINKEGIIIKTN